MKYSPLITAALLGALLTSAFGCSKNPETIEAKVEAKVENVPVVKVIDGQQYRFEASKVTQLSSNNDNLSFGILSDIHGDNSNVKYFVDEFQKRKVKGIIISGDLAERLRNNIADDIEMEEVLEEAAKSGLPIYVIPGNHDLRKDYEKALRDLSSKYPNLIDMSTVRVVDGMGVDIVSCPLMDDHFSVVYGRGFVGDCADLDTLVKQTNDAVIVVSHQPPLGKGSQGIDYVPTIPKNVGSAELLAEMNQVGVKVGVFGHIHEAGGRATTLDGKAVAQGEYSSELLLNPGPASSWQRMLATGDSTTGMAGILTVKGKEAKYEIMGR